MNPSLRLRVDRLARMSAEAGWDHLRSRAITGTTWKRVIDLLELTGSPEPFVSPCSDGSVHLNWTNNNDSFLVEVSDGKVDWTIVEGRSVVSNMTTGEWPDDEELEMKVLEGVAKLYERH